MDQLPSEMGNQGLASLANTAGNAPTSTSPNPPTVNFGLSASWPKSAQWTVAALLGGIVILLGFHALAGLRAGTRPSEHRESEGPIFRLDLNRARAAELGQLEGIGPTLADRIVAHRLRNGPFRTIEDLRLVSGIGPKTLERIRPWVCVENGAGQVLGFAELAIKPVAKTSSPSGRSSKGKKEALLIGQTINVNEASERDLQRLPGIGKIKSQRIIEERTKAPFKTVDELRRVKGIGPKTLAKIRPYVTVVGASAQAAIAKP